SGRVCPWPVHLRLGWWWRGVRLRHQNSRKAGCLSTVCGDGVGFSAEDGTNLQRLPSEAGEAVIVSGPTNLWRNQPQHAGQEIFEIQPVILGGSPTDPA